MHTRTVLKCHQKTSKVSLEIIPLSMHFIEDSQTSIKAIKYDIKHRHSTRRHRYSWNFENKVMESVPG